MVIRRRIMLGIDRFLAALDSEGVGLFQAIVYVHIVACALYLVAAAGGGVPDAVYETLGRGWDVLWLWLCMGPAVCLVGKVLSWRDSTRYAGFLMQLSGDLFGLGALVVYVFASVYTAWWGEALFAVFVCAAIAWCVLFLVIRDVRRIRQVEQQVKRGRR